MTPFKPLHAALVALYSPNRGQRAHPACSCAIAVAALCVGMAPSARAVGPASTERSTLEVQSELVPAVSDNRGGGSGSASTMPQAAMLSGAVRNTVWARRGVAAVGVGVQAPMGTVAQRLAAGDRANLTATNLLVGVAVNTGPRSSLVLDTPLAYRNSSTDSSLNPTEAGREVRVGLVIKPADPLRNLRGGQLFKLELSGRSQLALKPRSGGVAVSYSNRF